MLPCIKPVLNKRQKQIMNCCQSHYRHLSTASLYAGCEYFSHTSWFHALAFDLQMQNLQLIHFFMLI